MVALVGICGSMRKASLNRALLATVGETLPDGASLKILDGAVDLPIFNSDLPDPEKVTHIKAELAAAAGVVFAVPEYNYSIPGGLKNLLDWVSRPPASSPLRRKPVAMVGAATGISGTIRAQLHLRSMMLYSDAAVLGQPEVHIPRAQERFDADGWLTDASTRALLEKFGAAFVQLVAHHTP
ncbi:MAG: NAD(P)H-dependent oxidoreductase [Kofleriaceae bacterium]|nr:NAD(P)H-dependent oxidoreductase [Kofleriaceae bacterium]